MFALALTYYVDHIAEQSKMLIIHLPVTCLSFLQPTLFILFHRTAAILHGAKNLAGNLFLTETVVNCTLIEQF